MEDCDFDALLVSACDKLDNATSLLRSFTIFDKDEILAKFKANPETQIWFYDSFLDVLRRRGSPVANELSFAVERLGRVLRG